MALPNYEKIKEKNVISVGLTNNYVLDTAGNTEIALTKTIAQIGNRLRLSNGRIVIGSGVSYVCVSGKINMNAKNGSGNAKNMTIKHNSNECLISMNTIERTTDTNISRGLGSKLVKVSEGDTFSLVVYGGIGDTIQMQDSRTYVTVQVVD